MQVSDKSILYNTTTCIKIIDRELTINFDSLLQSLRLNKKPIYFQKKKFKMYYKIVPVSMHTTVKNLRLIQKIIISHIIHKNSHAIYAKGLNVSLMSKIYNLLVAHMSTRL